MGAGELACCPKAGEGRTRGIVAVEADAIVNPSILVGGGVSGAIRAAAHSWRKARLNRRLDVIPTSGLNKNTYMRCPPNRVQLVV